MSCTTGEHFRRMFKQDIFDPIRLEKVNAKPPTAEQLERLPLKNIVIVSIEEFEHLRGCILKGEINLVTFLREVAAAHTDPKTSVMFIDQMLGSKTNKWRLSGALEQASQQAEATLRGMLPS